ncbi:MAG: lipocalin-like domain-containing protein [Gemmatimonadota bacterium]
MPSAPTLPPPSSDLAHAIIGLWSLTSRRDYRADGEIIVDPIMGADPLGLLAFGPTQFSAQFMRRDRSTIGAAVSGPIGANNSGSVGGYDAYFGTYSLDQAAGSISIRLEGALTPANIGLSLTRDVRVNGSGLTIRLSTTATDGTPVERVLNFSRAT